MFFFLSCAKITEKFLFDLCFEKKNVKFFVYKKNPIKVVTFWKLSIHLSNVFEIQNL